MSQKGIQEFALRYLEAYSDRDFDALHDMLAVDVTLYELASQNMKAVALPIAEGIKPVREWLAKNWMGSLREPIAAEDIAVRDSFIYVRYVLDESLQAGTVFRIEDGRIAGLWIYDWYDDPEDYIRHFVTTLRKGGYDPEEPEEEPAIPGPRDEVTGRLADYDADSAGGKAEEEPAVPGPRDEVTGRLADYDADSAGGKAEEELEERRDETGRPTEPPDAAGRLASYDADSASGEAKDDLLDISPEVHALAAIMAAQTTAPPLAIGVFGDWGAGKTFFMRSLMRRIDQLAKAARGEDKEEEEQLQRDITFYKRIVQIEFNAWHYVEGNLWASLVQHIFANLRVSLDEDVETVPELQRRVLQHMGVEATAKYREEKQEEKKELEKRLEDLDEERREWEEQAQVSAGDILKSIKLSPKAEKAMKEALKEAGAQELGDAIQEFEAALAEARATLGESGSLLMPLVRAQDSGWRLVSLIGALFASVVASWLVIWGLKKLPADWVGEVSGVATQVATILSAVAVWLRSQAKWLSQRFEEFANANRHLQALRALEAKYEATEQQIAEIDAELAETTPVRLLARFIEDRADSDDYKKHLGLLALIRRDFGILSKHIEDENARLWNADEIADLAGEKKAEDERINRIVLYIDDLDRCPPRKVVQVLQAVHLLLAFPLFVVVVGVDARWVSHALQRYYPDLLGDDRSESVNQGVLGFGRDATPHDYLEKIFQIPIWLRPVSADGSKKMLEGLLGDKVTADPVSPVGDVEAGEEVPGETRRGEGGAIPGDEEVSTEGDEEEKEEVVETDQETEEADIGEEEERPIDLTPESLEIYRKELAFMKELAPIVGRSPRAVKRFVNVYRLVKAALAESDHGLDLAEMEPVSDYQAVMFLLAVVTGAPTISRQFFRAIRLHPDADPLDLVMKDMAALELTGAAKADLAGLEDWLNEEGREGWKTAPLKPFAKRAQQVARYSFRVEQREK